VTVLLLIVVAFFAVTNGGESPRARNCNRSDKMLIVNGCNEARFDDRTGSSRGRYDDDSWRRCCRDVGDDGAVWSSRRTGNVQHGRHV
jgi:hypothetical protein